jgi:hypothetical protein
MSERCRLCGRFAVRLEDRYCSPRCRELAGTYTSPPIAAAALAPPTTTYAATLLVAGGGLSRLGADSWEELEAAIEDAGAEVFTLQQFAGGGLAPAIPTRRGTT